jgi:hypothetical protein
LQFPSGTAFWMEGSWKRSGDSRTPLRSHRFYAGFSCRTDPVPV